MDGHNFRAQTNYSGQWNKHTLNVMAGWEIRQDHSIGRSNRYYGYDDNNLNIGVVDYNSSSYTSLITGSTQPAQVGAEVSENLNRFTSLFANLSYSYQNKYTVYYSNRRDASNIFGVSTNDKWKPLWSSGIAWDVSKEKFFSKILWIDFFKLRTSFGYSGNVDPNRPGITTIYYSSTNPYTNAPTAIYSSYYNPNLKWETSRQINIGSDFRILNGRISGSIDFYWKKNSDLFGPQELDYTTGIASIVRNVASSKGRGIDIQLIANIISSQKLNWQSTINLSTFKDKIISYNNTNQSASSYVDGSSISAAQGRPVYSIYAYKWAGLNPSTGDPQGYDSEGNPTKDYTTLTQTNTFSSLVYKGPALPSMYGSIIESFQYRNWSIDIGLLYKLGNYFRRNSIDYSSLYNNWNGHTDFYKRWQQPGDEKTTQIPSMVYPLDTYRDAFFAGSEPLVTKADFLRWQYCNFSYRFSIGQNPLLKHASIYFNLSNIGILWRANKENIDPEYINANPPSKQYAIGLRTSL